MPPEASAVDEGTRAAAVRGMFGSIAPRYDLLNHLLSFSVDRLWWWRTARAFDHILSLRGAHLLDLCCGTGDMTFAVLRRARRRRAYPRITGVDFSPEMLLRAQEKSRSGQYGAAAIEWLEADALNLPFAAGSFQLVTSAFGFRNLANYDAGLREIYRVLAPGGEVGILDFGEPAGTVGRVYRLYFRHVLPAVGAAVSGVRGPYSYLPASVQRFPAPPAMLARMRTAGFRGVSWAPYTLGIAGLYRGTKY